MMNEQYNKISPKAAGIALAVFWTLCVLILGLSAMCSGYGMGFVTALSGLYLGFAATIKGLLIGILWAFVDGLLTGLILAWLYNCALCCCNKKCKAETSPEHI